MSNERDYLRLKSSHCHGAHIARIRVVGVSVQITGLNTLKRERNHHDAVVVGLVW